MLNAKQGLSALQLKSILGMSKMLSHFAFPDPLTRRIVHFTITCLPQAAWVTPNA